MRPYRPYTPDQAFLLPPSLTDLIPEGDPVFFLRDVLQGLDFDAFRQVYRSAKGQPPYHPSLMVGLYLYGAMRRTYSSRKLAELASAMSPVSTWLAARPWTFTPSASSGSASSKGSPASFSQVLLLCREAGLVRLGDVVLDGTKVRANASKHKAMSYGRMLQKEPALEEEIAWMDEGQRQDKEEDAEYGPDDDGWSMPDELKETKRRLEKIKAGRTRLEDFTDPNHAS